ncbi:hypothetical protein IE53DRAFT_369000 [Violaceomyces palustris]|uniref:Uncharacterized protein n=1 Tax=Violaceomyces palustris TaxID=1673888 RepID=A0ACD0NWX6_9BASI|nr:hypothetical protein IE53DRAFT_369000 [Violaceomyces palustris]
MTQGDSLSTQAAAADGSSSSGGSANFAFSDIEKRLNDASDVPETINLPPPQSTPSFTSSQEALLFNTSTPTALSPRHSSGSGSQDHHSSFKQGDHRTSTRFSPSTGTPNPPESSQSPNLSGLSHPGGPPRKELLGSAGHGQMGKLLWSQREQSVVRNRQGGVLARGLVLKTDHFAGARPTHLDVHLQGAPNFRKADCSLEVYGVAQPTITGLKTILSVLRAQPVKESGFPHPEPHQSDSLPGGVVSPPMGTAVGDKPFPSFKDPSRPSRPESRHRRCVWVCTREEPVVYVGGRPFVLREGDRPLETFNLSGRADNLEGIELRLKQDILREASRYGGLLLVHEETLAGQIAPTWIAVDADSVYTVREVWERVRNEGWRVDYHRIPIAEDQALENNYLDAYTQVIKDMDPTNTSLVANCGVGFNRTTFAMVAAVIVRRKQMLLLGYEDPFASMNENPESTFASLDQSKTPSASVAKSIKQAGEQRAHNKSLLRLIRVLGESLSTKDTQSTIELLLSHPSLLESLRSANLGDYGVIRQLCGLLDEGLENKAVVDAAIDSCSHVLNLRENILLERLRYSTDAMDEAAASMHLEKAVKALEKYFFLVAFASYVNSSKTAVFQHRFSSWLKNRAEIWRGITLIRSKGRLLYFFDPVGDLSLISRGGTGDLAPAKSSASDKARDRFGEVSSQGAQVPGDEFADYVIRNRAGIVLRPFTLLKCDIWRKFIEKNLGLPVRGTVNFRRVPGSNIFATGQPTVEGINNILSALQEQYAGSDMGFNSPKTVTWLNLREEPLVYVNGKPYCLRQKGMSLRNIKAYSGINWDRLMLLEDRLKNDVLSELQTGEGRLLLHTETADGTVVPIWEEAGQDDVDTIQEVMDSAQAGFKDKIQLKYRRIPITAEKPLDFSDISALLSAVLQANVDRSPIVLNCQLGRGRSTLSAVIVLLIARWLKLHRPAYEEQLTVEEIHPGISTPVMTSVDGGSKDGDDDSEVGVGSLQSGRKGAIFDPVSAASRESSRRRKREPLSYHVINSLLRVIPKGLEVKRVVDECIDQCASVVNLRDAIEDARLSAEDTEDEALRRQRVQAGVYNLRRYFELIIFQAYLSTTPPDTMGNQPSFKQFVLRQPVFNTISKEFEKIDIETIMPLQKVDVSDGMALSDEVQEVVQNRKGSILSAFTMLKSDFFSGILKLGLPERIEGMPNLRGVPLLLAPSSYSSSSSSTFGYGGLGSTPSTPRTPVMTPGRETWGSGMPTLDGLRRGLTRMGASPNGPSRVVWTSLREEPVLYVNGRPHVLRLADQPLTNVEATGVTTDVVERMELALKTDMLAEARQRDGRVLLHDEVEMNGNFDIIPVWETVKDEDVMTPREVYELMQKEGFKVDYARLAITDEQAPVPKVFSQLEERVIKALMTGSSCVFNCQMGRGRTTTGMVIASLVSTVWHFGDEIFSSEMSASFSMINVVGGGSSSMISEVDDLSNAKDALDNREDDLWLQGEYRTILQLVGVLSHGKLAKKLTDRAIDRMEAVQNLRKAIYDSKLRADNADRGTKKHKHLSSVYTNYLQRYGYLIAFANYLLEKSQATSFQPLDDESDEGGEEQEEQAVITTTRERTRSTSSTLSDVSSSSNFGGKSSKLGSSSMIERNRNFPTFLVWLQTRREITGILTRSKLE